MKNTAIILSLISGTAAAQSPYLSVSARMDTLLANGKHYKIEMKICKPIQTSARDDWFTPDTSSIDFNGLHAADLHCGPFSGNGDGVEVLSGNTTFPEYDVYTFSNQVFAWENILVFRITDPAGGVGSVPMYIVLPVKYKSFVTFISIDSIPFVEGHVLDLGRSLGVYKNGSLSMQLKPDKSAAIPINIFAGTDWIE